MTIGDGLGWAACLMTLITFAQRQMLPLRVAAILANVCFIGYAAIGHYLPVLTLHLTLLPINGQRLFSLVLGQGPPVDPSQAGLRPEQIDHHRQPVPPSSKKPWVGGIA